MGKEYILRGVSLTGLTIWLNGNKIKSTNTPFTVGDVQQYADKTGYIPEYLGGNIIEKNKKNQLMPQTYNLLK